jgi:hypothetical protein
VLLRTCRFTCTDEIFGNYKVTPLGCWAMERLADSQPVMPENLTTVEMLARLAMFDQAQRRDLAWEWMAERDPEETVREILHVLPDVRSPGMHDLRRTSRAVYSPRSEPSLARRSSSSASSARRRLISRLTRVSSALACCSLT